MRIIKTQRIILTCIIFMYMFKVFSVFAYAAEPKDLFYNGEYTHDNDLNLATTDGGYDIPFVAELGDTSYNSYTLLYDDGKSVDNIFPYYTVCGYACFNNGNYLIVMCPEYIMISNGDVKGVDRIKINKDSSGMITSVERPSFYQLTGYTSSNTIEIDNVIYQIRSMKIGDGTVVGCPMSSYDGDFDINYVWGIGISMLSGIKQARQGVILSNANISVDTTNIEQLIASGNSIAENTSSSTKVIENYLTSFSSSEVGFNDNDRETMKRYDIWLVIIAFAVVLTLSRNVLHQMSSNIRGK